MIEQRRGDRRPRRFTEKLSLYMLAIAAFGAFIVLMEPKLVLAFSGGNTFTIGGTPFSADMKGAVVALIIVGGFVALKEYWLGASASQQTQSDTMGRIAEGVPPNPPKPPQPPEHAS